MKTGEVFIILAWSIQPGAGVNLMMTHQFSIHVQFGAPNMGLDTGAHTNTDCLSMLNHDNMGQSHASLIERG